MSSEFTSGEFQRILQSANRFYLQPQPAYPTALFGNWRAKISEQIKDIEVFNENTIKVTFNRDDVVTVTCDPEDNFSLTEGIARALLKYLIGAEANKSILTAVKMLDKKKKAAAKLLETAEQEKLLKERKQAKAARLHEKRMQKLAVKKLAAHEEAVAIQTEAILRANAAMSKLTVSGWDGK